MKLEDEVGAVSAGMVKTLPFFLGKKTLRNFIVCYIDKDKPVLHGSNSLHAQNEHTYTQTNKHFITIEVKSCKSNGTYFVKMDAYSQMHVKRLTFWIKCNMFLSLKSKKKDEHQKREKINIHGYISLMNGWELKLVEWIAFQIVWKMVELRQTGEKQSHVKLSFR